MLQLGLWRLSTQAYEEEEYFTTGRSLTLGKYVRVEVYTSIFVSLTFITPCYNKCFVFVHCLRLRYLAKTILSDKRHVEKVSTCPRPLSPKPVNDAKDRWLFLEILH